MLHLVWVVLLLNMMIPSLVLCRSVVKQLQPYQPQLQSLYGRIKVKAGKEGALYKKYEDELKLMVTKLDEFVMDCTVKIFEAEDIKPDAVDDDIFHKTKRSMEAVSYTHLTLPTIYSV